MILQIKDEGSLVERLQEKLNIASDGIFGKETEDVVKDFQKKNSLRVDGILGDATFKLLGFDFSRYVKNGTNFRCIVGVT